METRSRRAGMANSTRSRSSQKAAAQPEYLLSTSSRERKRSRIPKTVAGLGKGSLRGKSPISGQQNATRLSTQGSSSAVDGTSIVDVVNDNGKLTRKKIIGGEDATALGTPRAGGDGNPAAARGTKRKRETIQETESANVRMSGSQNTQQDRKDNVAQLYRETAMAKRQDQLTREEKRLKTWEETLSQRELNLLRTEENLMTQAEKTLGCLEEEFSCSLCFDIMASPYSLSPSRCGHSFCAICILKWFFSHLHNECLEWHTALECPLCRTELPKTSDLPRSMLSCPFTPNRLADSVLTHLTDSLITLPVEGSQPSQPGQGGRLATSPETTLRSWAEGGSSRKNWHQRVKRGRDEMNFLINNWTNLRPTDLVAIKERLLHV